MPQTQPFIKIKMNYVIATSSKAFFLPGKRFFTTVRMTLKVIFVQKLTAKIMFTHQKMNMQII